MPSSLLTRPFLGVARKTFRPLLALYYRSLYGRRYPFSDRIAGWFAAGERWTGRGDVPLTKEAWESQYREGEWDFLTGIEELARYSLIASSLHHLKPGGSVLDVGCGEGLLVDHLAPFGARRYTGVDVSDAAIEKAAGRADESTAFLAADASSFTTGERFDAVVLNECLYYFDRPLEVIDGYRELLEDGGIFVVSMFRSWRTRAILRRLRDLLPAIAETRISNRKGTWTLAWFQGRPR